MGGTGGARWDYPRHFGADRGLGRCSASIFFTFPLLFPGVPAGVPKLRIF